MARVLLTAHWQGTCRKEVGYVTDRDVESGKDAHGHRAFCEGNRSRWPHGIGRYETHMARAGVIASGGRQMSDEKKRELTPEELEAQEGEELPDREEMSLLNA